MRCYFHAANRAVAVCSGCLRALCAACAAEHVQACPRLAADSFEAARPAADFEGLSDTCRNHPFTPARALCVRCQRPICKGCGAPTDGYLSCPDCLPRVESRRTSRSKASSPGLLDLSRYHRVPRVDPAETVRSWVVLAGLAVVAVTVILALVAYALEIPTSTAEAGQAAATPADVVREHYSYLCAHDYPAAWDLLSPSYRSKVDYDAWVAAHHGVHFETTGLATVKEAGGTAEVVGTVIATRREDGETATLQGTWELVRLGGAWRLNRLDVEEGAGPGRDSI